MRFLERGAGLRAALLCGLLLAEPPHGGVRAQAAQGPPDEPTISLVTFGRGAQVHQYFGHNALVVDLGKGSPALVYNYGSYRFGPWMIPRFLRGRLSFWLAIAPLDKVVPGYVAQGREVRLRTLNLRPAQARAVLRRLTHDARPENRVYLYDHYHDNCSTRVRDVLDAAVGGQLKAAWAAASAHTLRTQTRRYTRENALVEWAMMFGLNDEVDRPMTRWDDAFLPDELEQLIDATQVVDASGARVPLVKHASALHRAEPGPDPVVATRWPYTLGVGLFIAGLALALAHHDARSFALFACLVGTASGCLGSLATFLWAYSDHLVTYRNENLLLASPMTLVSALSSLLAAAGSRSALFWQRRSWGAMAASTTALLTLKVLLPTFDQGVTLTVTLFAPINLGFAYASRLVLARHVKATAERQGAQDTSQCRSADAA